MDVAAAQASAVLLWGSGATLAVAGAGGVAGRPEASFGEQGTQPKTVRGVAGATRTGKGARIYGASALNCSGCGGWVRLVGLVTEPATVRQILELVGEATTALAFAAARSPTLAMNVLQLAALE